MINDFNRDLCMWYKSSTIRTLEGVSMVNPDGCKPDCDGYDNTCKYYKSLGELAEIKYKEVIQND